MKAKVKVKKQAVPGTFTLLNLLFGFLAIIQASQGQVENACWLILGSSLFDSLDGPTARALKVTSPFGIEFDSIADIVSFCTAPAVITYFAFAQQLHPLLGASISFVPLFAGAFRLARFNIDASEVPSPFYSGLPTTAFAVIVSSYVIFNTRLTGNLGDPRIALSLIFLSSLLMLTSIPYLKLTYIGKNWRSRVRVIFFLFSLAALTWWRGLVLFPLTMLYVLGSLVRFAIHKNDFDDEIPTVTISQNKEDTFVR